MNTLRNASWLFLVVCSMAVAAAQSLNHDPTPRTRFQRVLFLGNSITIHGPKPDIGWTGNWGMAASAEEKDFVHIVLRSLAGTAGLIPHAMVQNIADFERQYATFDVQAKLRDACEFRPDLIVVAIGENVTELNTAEAKGRFGASLAELLRAVKGDRLPTVIVLSCFRPNQAKDEVLKRVSEQSGSNYVDIGPLAKDEANLARSERNLEHAGVAGHPGDKGMLGIANAILQSINKQRTKAAPSAE